MKKLNNKGFTLIEIVIVIVIIAILAAMLVPSLTQWIDKSKKKTFVSACGTVRTAVSSAVAEQYAVDGTYTVDPDAVGKDVGKKVAVPAAFVATGKSNPADADYTVSAYSYENDTMTITDGTWTSTYNGKAWSDPTKS